MHLSPTQPAESDPFLVNDALSSTDTTEVPLPDVQPQLLELPPPLVIQIDPPQRPMPAEQPAPPSQSNSTQGTGPQHWIGAVSDAKEWADFEQICAEFARFVVETARPQRPQPTGPRPERRLPPRNRNVRNF